MNKKITVMKNGQTYTAVCERTGHTGKGKTQDEAVAALVLSAPARFDIEITVDSSCAEPQAAAR